MKLYTDGASRSYNWMKNSCSALGKRLCTYAELCPDGAGNSPAAGSRLAASSSPGWAPFVTEDGGKDWAQLGKTGAVCAKLSSEGYDVEGTDLSRTRCPWCNSGEHFIGKSMYGCCGNAEPHIDAGSVAGQKGCSLPTSSTRHLGCFKHRTGLICIPPSHPPSHQLRAVAAAR